MPFLTLHKVMSIFLQQENLSKVHLCPNNLQKCSTLVPEFKIAQYQPLILPICYTSAPPYNFCYFLSYFDTNNFGLNATKSFS